MTKPYVVHVSCEDDFGGLHYQVYAENPRDAVSGAWALFAQELSLDKNDADEKRAFVSSVFNVFPGQIDMAVDASEWSADIVGVATLKKS